MILFSTNHQSSDVGLEEAIFRGLPQDNGLYMPTTIPTLSSAFFDRIEKLNIVDIALEVSKCLLGDDITAADLEDIVTHAISFDSPVVGIRPSDYVMELFHGPSMAFKDFGARYMASLMSYFLVKSSREIRILVATSGDTGGAVAQGFYKTPGISVTILYPSGKVSDIQEKQLTTLGENVTALEVNGTFDDCQYLVKQAFLDKELTARYNLASANSINIARLIPQSFYYFSAYAQLKALGKPLVFSVPSGNFGNLSAGIMAYRMGLPVERFIAATNINNVVPQYLATSEYMPKPSAETISNAMDVGSPSNFIRMKLLAGEHWERVKALVAGYYYDDTQTRMAMAQVFGDTGYVMCPHTAVAYLGLQDYRQETASEATGVFLSTAHPAKFLEVVEDTIGTKVPLPERLEAVLHKPKAAIKMTKEFADFKSYLLG